MAAPLSALRAAFASILEGSVPAGGAVSVHLSAGGSARGDTGAGAAGGTASTASWTGAAGASRAAAVDDVAASARRFMDAAKDVERLLGRARRRPQRDGTGGGGGGSSSSSSSSSGSTAPGARASAAATRREIVRVRAELAAKDELIAKAMLQLEQWSGRLASSKARAVGD